LKPFTLRQAQPEDAARLTAIAFAAKRHWGYPETWIQQWRADLTISHQNLVNPTLVVCLEDEMAAFCMVSGGDGEWDLEHLWVHPNFMGMGMGKTLFNAACDLCRKRGGRSLTILSDPNALEFYLKMGCVSQRSVASAIPGRTLPELRYSL